MCITVSLRCDLQDIEQVSNGPKWRLLLVSHDSNTRVQVKENGESVTAVFISLGHLVTCTSLRGL